MRKLLALALVTLALALSGLAQTTAVTLQVTDTPDGQTWNNGNFQAQLIGVTGSITGPFNFIPAFGGTPLSTAQTLTSGVLSSSGGASFSLVSNTAISPAGSQWKITVCPNASAPCPFVIVTITGATQTVQPAPPSIRIPGANAPPTTLAYADAEVVNPALGTQYFNVISFVQRQWNGTVWVNIGGGGGSPGGLPTQVQFNNAGSFGGSSDVTYTAATHSFLPLSLDNSFYATAFNFSQSPSGTLSIGANTVTLNPAPIGVSGLDVTNATPSSSHPHALYIAGTGTPEPVLITGGTCVVNASVSPCTVTFNAAFAHGAGFTISSATAGAQETLSYIRSVRSGPANTNAYKMVLPSGNTIIFNSPLYIDSPHYNLVVNGDGAVIECTFLANCIAIGDTSQFDYLVGTTLVSSILGSNITFQNLSVMAGIAGWQVTPSAPSTITAGSSTATLTIPTGPTGFYAAIPGQYVWLNGTTGGLEGTYRGTGELARVTGGTCANGGASCTITIVPAEPGGSAGTSNQFAGHDAGYTLSGWVGQAFEDNDQGTAFENVHPGSINNFKMMGFFQDDNDQSEVIDGFSAAGPATYPLASTSEYQGSYVFSPGPFSIYAGIATIQHSNFSLQCQGNAVEWYSGNKLDLTDVIIQGWASFGSKLSISHGGFGPRAMYKDVYSELGSCTNPTDGSMVSPDMMIVGYDVVRTGPATLQHSINQFAGAQTGQTWQTYYISIASTAGGAKNSVPIPIGAAQVTNPSTNNITVKWFTSPTFASGSTPTTGFDLLRVTGGTGFQANEPTGTGNYAVATNLNPATVCNVHGVCSFTDTLANASLTSYTVQNTVGNAAPLNGDYFDRAGFGAAWLVGGGSYTGVPTCIYSNQPTGFADIFFLEGQNLGITGGQGPCLMGTRGVKIIAYPAPASGTPFPALSLPDTPAPGSSTTYNTNLTGVLNLGRSALNEAEDFITLYDSAPDVTEASHSSSVAGSVFGRRNLLAGDMGICKDGSVFSSGQLCFRAPTAIDSYINTVPTAGGTTWLTQLSGSAFVAKVPVNGTVGFQQNGTALGINCGTAAACANTATPLIHFVIGSAPLVSASPSAVTITGISPAFTSATSYFCTVTDATNAANNLLKVSNVSGSSFTITGPNTLTDVVNYLCTGT